MFSLFVENLDNHYLDRDGSNLWCSYRAKAESDLSTTN